MKIYEMKYIWENPMSVWTLDWKKIAKKWDIFECNEVTYKGYLRSYKRYFEWLWLKDLVKKRYENKSMQIENKQVVETKVEKVEEQKVKKQVKQ